MIEIIQKSKRIRVEQYLHQWTRSGNEDSDYAFPCDKSGRVQKDDLSDQAFVNYEQCLTCRDFDGEPLVDDGVEDISYTYIEGAVGRCKCGEEIVLDGFTNECEHCHRLYNASGQQLSDPGTWGEETGEHPADVRRIE